MCLYVITTIIIIALHLFECVNSCLCSSLYDKEHVIVIVILIILVFILVCDTCAFVLVSMYAHGFLHGECDVQVCI